MNDIARALARAVVSQLHPRMLWLAIWPFLVAILFWGIAGWLAAGTSLAWINRTAGATAVGSWVDTTFAWVGLSGGASVLAMVAYVGLLFGLTVLTALLIIATVAMPAVVAHVSSRDYPALARKRGGTYLGSVGNAIGVGLVFLVGFVVTIPLWLIAPLAVLLPLFWWGWATARMFRYDALVEHASAEERKTLFARHGKAFLGIGIAVSLLNFVPPLFFLVPILGGLAFTHYALRALATLRAERGEIGGAPAPIIRDGIIHPA